MKAIARPLPIASSLLAMNFAAQLAHASECCRIQREQAEAARVARMSTGERESYFARLRCFDALTETPMSAQQIADKAEITLDQARRFLSILHDEKKVDRKRRSTNDAYLWWKRHA